MLKIKDNVKLEELEKHGLEKQRIRWRKNEVYAQEHQSYEYLVVEDNRQISLYIDDEYYENDCSNVFADTLYDLIQAGLVEKVENEK